MDNEMKEFFKQQKKKEQTAPDGTPLVYNGPLVLDGDAETNMLIDEIMFGRKLSRK